MSEKRNDCERLFPCFDFHIGAHSLIVSTNKDDRTACTPSAVNYPSQFCLTVPHNRIRDDDKFLGLKVSSLTARKKLRTIRLCHYKVSTLFEAINYQLIPPAITFTSLFLRGASSASLNVIVIRGITGRERSLAEEFLQFFI